MRKIDSVPLVLSNFLDSSDEAYIVTRKELRKLGKDIEGVAGEPPNEIIAVMPCESIKGYYIFTRRLYA